jgi:tol-pal system protein YbgF
MREMRTRLALAQAQSAESLPRETVRIGSPAASGSESTSFADDEGGAWDDPEDNLPTPPEPAATEEVSTRPRPVLRLYGTRDEPLPDVPVRAIPAAEASGWARASLPVAPALTPLPTSPQVEPAPLPLPAAAAPAPRARAAFDIGRESYRAALGELRAQRFERALAGFDRFLTDHPSHHLAANARYWRAESLYIQREYRRARSAFRLYVRLHPQGRKVAEAMLKIGLCHQHMGDPAAAHRAFEQLQQEHPESVAARTAMREDV